MRKVVAFTSLMSGLLFILIPRFILPACEYEGFPRMHCSDTAQAEQVVGAVLIAVSCTTFLLRSTAVPLVSAVLSATLFGIALWLPDKFGYCLSPRMPCHYGMVPAIRFLSIIGILAMAGAIASIAKSMKKKGSS